MFSSRYAFQVNGHVCDQPLTLADTDKEDAKPDWDR